MPTYIPPFRPDRDADGSGNTNGDRAERARGTLVYYARCELREPPASAHDPDTLADLITDLRHYCDKHGLDFTAIASQAEGHHLSER